MRRTNFIVGIALTLLFTPTAANAQSIPGALAESTLPANAVGAPITYMAGGKQFIVFPVGGGPLVEELIAVSL